MRGEGEAKAGGRGGGGRRRGERGRGGRCSYLWWADLGHVMVSVGLSGWVWV